MTTYSWKKGFQALVRPVALYLIKKRITPNQVTVFTVLLSLAYSAGLACSADWRAFFYTVPLLFLVRMALNAIDGLMAVEGNMKTQLGVFLNELGDVISDTALYLSFGIFPFVNRPLLIVFVLIAVLSELAGIVSVSIGSRRRYDGPMGKSDRAVLMGLCALMIASGVESEAAFNVILAIGCLGLVLTVINRVRRALNEAQNRPSAPGAEAA